MEDMLRPTIDTISVMPREAFRQRFVCGFARTERFSRVASLGADSLSEQEREQFWQDLRKEGIPIPDVSLWQRPDALETVVCAITGRSVQVR